MEPEKINNSYIFNHFCCNNYYRYLDLPDTIKDTSSIMDYFLGEDKSYRLGCPFDDGDIIIEFNFKNDNIGMAIGHHPLSFRGPLIIDNINIVNIYINNREDYFIDNKFLEKYYLNIIKLVNNLSTDNKKLVKYYDELNETHMPAKIKNFEFFDEYIVFNGVNKYK